MTPPTVLHYTGYDEDVGGVLSVVRALAAANQFACVLGVNRGFVQRRAPSLALLELPTIAGDTIGPLEAWKARAVARAVGAWLDQGPDRVFHGHSRAGLLVGLWLAARRERRVVVSVHVYGHQRWFYRWAARRLDDGLYWLSPAMRRYYGVDDGTWDHCMPGGVPGLNLQPARPVPQRLRLGGAGSLVDWKNWPLVVEAMALLPDDLRARVTFDHVGGGSDEIRREALALVARHGLERQVAFRGSEPSADALLTSIDALVVASHNEPFSMSMLEALDVGVPVLAADSGGATDIIREGVNGGLFRTGDPQSLATAITAWLTSPPAFDPDRVRQTGIRAGEMASRWLPIYTARAAR